MVEQDKFYKYESEKKLNFFSKNPIISLLIIGISGFFIRIIYLPYDISLTLDAFLYFWYANDISITGTLPSDYSPANNGWPIFLSIFFRAFDSSNFLDYMMIQRLVSVIISCLTIIPVYVLCRRFFDNHFALIGAFIFAFEPRIIQNSVLGITEPLFIILTSIAFVLFLSSQKKMMYFAFALISLASIVRSEGLVLFIPFSILFFIRFRKNKKKFFEYPLLVLVFVLILLPIAIYRTEVLGNDALISRIFYEINQLSFLNQESIEQSQQNFSIESTGGVENFLKLAGWSTIPIFIFLIPYGVYKIFREHNYNNLTIIILITFMLIFAMYAMSHLPDTRYLYFIYPLFIVLSLFTVHYIVKRSKNQNIILFLIISAILLASIGFLEVRKVDIDHKEEALQIASFVSNSTRVINQYLPESGYLPIVGLKQLDDFPILRGDFMSLSKDKTHCPNVHICNQIIPIQTNSLEEFIESSKSSDLSHLIVDDVDKRRKDFIKDVFHNEEKYPYLEKIFDSKSKEFNYHLKIFRIDYEKFDEFRNKVSE